MEENKIMFLYQIDEQSKNVIFVETINNKNEWKKVLKNHKIILSFDEVYNDIIALRKVIPYFEKIENKIVETIAGPEIPFNKVLKKFVNYQAESNNFFFQYYHNLLRNLFIDERKNIDNASKYHAFSYDNLQKLSIENINTQFNEVKKIINDEWNLNLHSENTLHIFDYEYKKIIISGNDMNEIYTIADSSLANFFYDFSFSLHKLNLYVCECNYCHIKFWGAKNSECCNSESCQKIYTKVQKNKKRREKDNGRYQKYKTRLSNYIGQQKNKLPTEIKNDHVLIAKFDAQRKIYTKAMEDKLEEYRMKNCLPDDELENFYEKMKKKVTIFAKSLGE